MISIAFHCVWRRVTERRRSLVACLLAWLHLMPAGAADISVGSSYRIQPTDILIIEVANEPKLAAKEFRVTAAGDVSYPFIGAIRVADKTTEDVQREIKALLETDYLVDAQVLVQVRDFRKSLVSVFGQVNRPGRIVIPPERRMTVIEAISEAGGLTRLARSSGIQVIRAGKKEPTLYNMDDLKNPDKPVYVEPDDVVFVPESRI